MRWRELSQPIIESLYEEALALADETRNAFYLSLTDAAFPADDPARLALSIEGMRTTTRIMHVLAWLLNQRAYLKGELTEAQELRDGVLGTDRPSDPEQMRLLEPETRALIDDTERLYARITRLDDNWRLAALSIHPPVQQMQHKITEAFDAEPVTPPAKLADTGPGATCELPRPSLN